MGLLGDRFREMVKQSKNPKMEEASFDVMYPTGFLPFDYLNGYITVVNLPNGKKMMYNSIGILDGTSNLIIGRTGAGKTSFAVQAGANIIRPFENGQMFIDDIEGGSNKMRMYKLSGFSPEECENRIIYRNSAISAENFYERIYDIYEDKLNHKADYEYDTGLLDTLGRPVYKLVPTVYILDSLAMLMPDKLTEEEEMSGQMSTTASAKTNTAALRRIIPKLKAANIILFVINHIYDKIETNMFAKSKALMVGLKQDETLPGGKANNYLSNNAIRIDDNVKLKDSEGLGINGKIVDFTLIKSRTNMPLRSVSMVFDYDDGYDPVLSLFTYMKANGYIESRGAYMNFPGSDIKFTQRNFLEKLNTDPEFTNLFMSECNGRLQGLLKAPETQEEKEKKQTYNTLLSSMIASNTKMIDLS